MWTRPGPSDDHRAYQGQGAGKLERDPVAFAVTVKELEVKRLPEIKGHVCRDRLSCS
ncbi:hypothetical protein OAG11_00565 [Verrucomicrobia bacterium]|nr:hypothetical protein [Verrucomicrobiota bacterium]